MAKLQDLHVNVIPKLDLRRAKAMSAQLEAILMQKMLPVSQANSLLGRTGKVLQQGGQFLDKLISVLDKPRTLVQESMDAAQLIEQSAQELGSSPQRVAQIINTLAKGGAAEKTTLQLMQKFAQNAPHLNIAGNLDDAFIAALRQIQESQGAQRQALINRYLGQDATQMAQNAIQASANWFALKSSPEENQLYAQAISKAYQVQQETENIAFKEQMQRLMFAFENGHLQAQIRMVMEEEQAKTRVLHNTSAQEMQEITRTNLQLQSTLEAGLQKLVALGAKIADDLGAFQVLNDSITKLSETIKGWSPGKMWQNANQWVNNKVDHFREFLSDGKKDKGQTE